MRNSESANGKGKTAGVRTHDGRRCRFNEEEEGPEVSFRDAKGMGEPGREGLIFSLN
jgi:hypothetical protein